MITPLTRSRLSFLQKETPLMRLPDVQPHSLGFNYLTSAYFHLQGVICCNQEMSFPEKSSKGNVCFNRIHFVLFSYSWDHNYHMLCGGLHEDLLKQTSLSRTCWTVTHGCSNISRGRSTSIFYYYLKVPIHQSKIK